METVLLARARFLVHFTWWNAPMLGHNNRTVELA